MHCEDLLTKAGLSIRGMQLSDSDPEAKESVNQKQNLNFFLSSHFLPELPME